MTQPRKSRPDVANPPAGTRLELTSICAFLEVTLQQLADAAGISRSSMSRIATSNDWPSTHDAGAIKVAVLQLLADSGATPDMLACAFHAHVSNRAPWTHRARAISLARATPHTPTPDDDEDTMLLPKQTLTPEARRAFKLFANPFDGEVQTDAQMFRGDEVEYVREACWQCAQTASFVAVVGESGAGKTTILGDLEARIESQAQHCITFRPSVLGMEDNDTKGKTLKSTDILHSIIATLDPVATIPQTLQARTDKAAKMLQASAQAGNAHLLVIEEAHSLPDATLKHLKRLHEMRAGRRPLMGILLLAHPELKLRLDAGLRGGHLREVAQRCEIVQLLPLDSELGSYLKHRARAAGREITEFIAPEGIEALRQKLTRTTAAQGSKGGRVISLCYPLAVNNLITRCLNEAAALGVPVINRDVVMAV